MKMARTHDQARTLRSCCIGGRVHDHVRVVHSLAQPDEQVEDVRVVVQKHTGVYKGVELRTEVREPDKSSNALAS